MSLSSHQKTKGKNNEWLTPQWILERLGEFDLDPCAPCNPPWPTAKHYYTKLDNGLTKPWFGRVWLNPPFDRYQIAKWMQKMKEHGNGIALLAARTETKMFFKYVWGSSSGVLFMRGRPHFCLNDGMVAPFNSGAPICLIAYGEENLGYLIKSNLGVVVKEV